MFCYCCYCYCSVTYPPPPYGPGWSWGWKLTKNFRFPVDLTVQKYGNAGYPNGVIRCQTALPTGPVVAPSPRSPAFCI